MAALAMRLTCVVMRSMSPLIVGVLQRRSPSEVLRAIVEMVAIEMPHLKVGRWFQSMECLADKCVDGYTELLPCLRDGHTGIAVGIAARLKYFSSVPASPARRIREITVQGPDLAVTACFIACIQLRPRRRLESPRGVAELDWSSTWMTLLGRRYRPTLLRRRRRGRCQPAKASTTWGL
jgi:hypothetical protein